MGFRRPGYMDVAEERMKSINDSMRYQKERDAKREYEAEIAKAAAQEALIQESIVAQENETRARLKAEQEEKENTMNRQRAEMGYGEW